MNSYILFEPEDLSPFAPISLLQSLADLRYGIYSNMERAQQLFPADNLQLWVRPVLAGDQAEKHPETLINCDANQDAVFFNAATPAWMYPSALKILQNSPPAAILVEGRIVAAKPGRNLKFTADFHQTLAALPVAECDPETCSGQPKWIWDYLNLINPATEFDSDLWQAENDMLTKLPPDLATLCDRNIFIHNTAQIGKFVHLDARDGPIVIDQDSIISPFCSIVGPAYLGKRSALKPSTSLSHSVIGRVCNLGGEIKSSIFHPYSNKAHDGYLGDSLVGSWVNLGAGTTTSNLKNNYQPIRVVWDGDTIETGRQFLGSIIGDHSKTAIGVRLITGTMIGLFCNIFQADFPPRSIPSFSWGNDSHEIDKAIQTALIMMKRRGLILSEAQIGLIKKLAEDQSQFYHF